MNFDECFAALIAHEGDFADLENDPGGKTRFGVTEAVARAAGYGGDMRQLPLSLAKAIYRSQYWDAVRGDELPDGVRYYVFDAAAAGTRDVAAELFYAFAVICFAMHASAQAEALFIGTECVSRPAIMQLRQLGAAH